MKIIEPAVEFWPEYEKNIHVARCARVCYGKTEGDNEKTIGNLLSNRHYSVFRHSTNYYIVPKNDSIINTILFNIKMFIIDNNIKLIGIDIKEDKNDWYVVINGQFMLEHSYICSLLNEYKVSSEYFENTKIGYTMMRYTFAITTQISTSREFNRVSPNNITEQSTRYVYEDGIIVRPHWITKEDIKNYYNEEYTNHNDNAIRYLTAIEMAFDDYMLLCTKGIKKQDARGLLPLDTATKVIYTYSIEEWRHILKLRCDKRAHPNAQIIANMIKKELINLGYEFN